MAKFKILTPVRDYDGRVGDPANATVFMNGCAEIDVVDQGSASRLAYFRSAGYGVEELDGVSAEDAIRQAVLTPEQEHAELVRERDALKQARELESLRAEVKRMRPAGEDGPELSDVAKGSTVRKGGAR